MVAAPTLDEPRVHGDLLHAAAAAAAEVGEVCSAAPARAAIGGTSAPRAEAFTDARPGVVVRESGHAVTIDSDAGEVLARRGPPVW